MTVERSYTVKVSPVVREEAGGVSLRLPSDPDLAPAPEALAWHADHGYSAADQNPYLHTIDK